MHPRILQITENSIENPTTGGALRRYHVRDALRKTFCVKTLSIMWGTADHVSGLSVTLNRTRLFEDGGQLLWEDIGLKYYLERHCAVLEPVFQSIREYSPDIILLENPYVWTAVEILREDAVIRHDAYIVYSAHGTEGSLKIGQAHLGFAASDTDRDYIRAASPTIPVQTFLNGHSVPASRATRAAWSAIFSKETAQMHWVFVGSRFPANINGLLHFCEALSKRPHGNIQIWIFGNAGPGLLDAPGFSLRDHPFVRIVGTVSEDDIDSAIGAATGVLLPIWEGTSSLVKTAQALLSNKPIVSSRFAFHGFDAYKKEPGVWLTDSLTDTPDALADLIGLIPAAHHERPYSRNTLSWQTTLAFLPAFVQENYQSAQWPSAQ